MKSRILKKIWLVILPLMWTSCDLGGGGDGTSQTLSGVMDGAKWTFKSGRADVNSGGNSNRLDLKFFSQNLSDICGDLEPEYHLVIESVPSSANEYELGTNYEVIFRAPSQNHTATEGRLILNSVESNRIVGSLDAEVYGDEENNSVSGEFTLTNCAFKRRGLPRLDFELLRSSLFAD